MSDKDFICPHLESCPNVLAACERYVRAEAEASLRSAKVAELEGRIEAYESDIRAFADRREAMNQLYVAAVRFQQARRKYFCGRTPERVEDLNTAQACLDEAIKTCKNLGKPVNLKEYLTP